jgi:hypothetical protein
VAAGQDGGQGTGCPLRLVTAGSRDAGVLAGALRAAGSRGHGGQAAASTGSRWRDGSHRLASGTLLTYAWAGFVLLSLEGAATTVNLLGQAALVLGAAALLSAAARRTPDRGGGRVG